jgi:hypothetical protein
MHVSGRNRLLRAFRGHFPPEEVFPAFAFSLTANSCVTLVVMTSTPT